MFHTTIKALYFLAFLLSAQLCHGQVPQPAWGTLFTGHGEVRVGNVVLAEGVDGCLINGSFTQDVFFPQDTLIKIDGWDDHFIARLNYLGTNLWAVHVSGEVRSLRLQGDGQVIAIATYADSCVVGDQVIHSNVPGVSFAVIRISEDGTLIDLENHQGVIGSYDDEYNTIKAVTDVDEHGIHITGLFNDSLRVADTLLIGGQASAYLAKFTDTFDLLWVQRLGRAVPPNTLPVDSLGSIYYTIESPFWTSEDTLLGDSPAGLLCLDPDGGERWRYSPEDIPPWSPTVAVMHPNEVYFQSEYAEGSPIVRRYVQRLNAEGELTQEVVYTTQGSAWLTPTSHPDGGVLMSGPFYGDVTYPECTLYRGLPTHAIMKWDDEGICEWSTVIAGGNDWGREARVTAAGSIYTSGIFEFSVDLGPDTLHGATLGLFSGYVTAMTAIPLSNPEPPILHQVTVSPNPANSSVRITRYTSATEAWRVIDAMGKEVAFGTTSSSTVELDLSNYPSGVYIYRSGGEFARIIKD